jgi:hypothetical protein
MVFGAEGVHIQAYPGATEHPPCGFMLGAHPGADPPDAQRSTTFGKKRTSAEISTLVDQSRDTCQNPLSP